MRTHSKAQVGQGFSRFLVTYLVALFGLLMLVHVLQPPGEATDSSSTAPPAHQSRQVSQRQAALPVPDGIR